MRIDELHRSWAIATLTIFAIGAALFVPYALFYPGGAHGRTIPGLTYGILGYAMMLFAGLKGARKKVPLWRVGRAQHWMRGHIWFGMLSLPMILFHGAFRARGQLTFLLVALLVTVVLSGIVGALFQHFLPKRLTSAVQMETIYEQIPHVRRQLRDEVRRIIEKLVPELRPASDSHEHVADSWGVAEVHDEGTELTEDQRRNLRQVFEQSLLPFLENPELRYSPLGDVVKAPRFFDALRRQLPRPVHAAIGDIENICEENRQLTRQRRMYYWLHGWLLVHVPLSVLLLVLGGIHALVAIRY